MDKPNLLFIMMDQCRADVLGCMGGWARTPNMDRIAAEGVLFDNCVTTTPVCIPARVSMATGWYPHNTGVWNNMRYTLPADAPTWMRAVREAGYRTSLFGKTHLHPHHGDLRDRENLMHAYGLDDVDEIGGPRASARVGSHMTEMWEKAGLWEKYKEDYAERFSTKPHIVRPSPLPLEMYADVYVGRQAKNYLADYEREEPFMCWVSFGGPHEPWDAPEPYASMYDPEQMPEPAPVPEEGHERPRGRVDQMQSHRPQFEPGDIAAMRANYAGNVTLIDDQIGEILQVLEERGMLENTVIAVSSDHGEMNGDHGLIYKSNFYDGCLRVPMIVRVPGQAEPGRVCSSPCEWFDLGPTFAELAGAEMEHQQFARSLCPVARGEIARHRPFALSEISGEVMLMDDQWKIVVNSAGQPYMLFNRHKDPEEVHNLAGRPEAEEIARSLRLRMLEHLVQTQRHSP